jgi:hypothetical protein
MLSNWCTCHCNDLLTEDLQAEQAVLRGFLPGPTNYTAQLRVCSNQCPTDAHSTQSRASVPLNAIELDQPEHQPMVPRHSQCWSTHLDSP